MILAASQGGELVHGLLNDCRSDCVVFVDCLTTGEINIRVLGSTAHGWAVRAESAGTMSCYQILIDHCTHIVIGKLLDFHNLMRGTETIEEMNKRNSGTERCLGGDQCHIHTFLNALGAQHCPTGLTSCVYVSVITEDRKTLACNSAGGDVEDGRGKLTGDLVHVRDHQQKPLRCGECGTQRASSE